MEQVACSYVHTYITLLTSFYSPSLLPSLLNHYHQYISASSTHASTCIKRTIQRVSSSITYRSREEHPTDHVTITIRVITDSMRSNEFRFLHKHHLRHTSSTYIKIIKHSFAFCFPPSLNYSAWIKEACNMRGGGGWLGLC